MLTTDVRFTWCADGVRVSTVEFPERPGSDPDWHYETMTFGGGVDSQLWAKYGAREDAEAGHARCVAEHGGSVREREVTG